jgi:hypothetical protein
VLNLTAEGKIGVACDIIRLMSTFVNIHLCLISTAPIAICRGGGGINHSGSAIYRSLSMEACVYECRVSKKSSTEFVTLAKPL